MHASLERNVEVLYSLLYAGACVSEPNDSDRGPEATTIRQLTGLCGRVIRMGRADEPRWSLVSRDTRSEIDLLWEQVEASIQNYVDQNDLFCLLRAAEGVLFEIETHGL